MPKDTSLAPLKIIEVPENQIPQYVYAEGAGFEPAKPLLTYTLSKRAPSATRTPLCIGLQSKRFKFVLPIDIYAKIYDSTLD